MCVCVRYYHLPNKIVLFTFIDVPLLSLLSLFHPRNIHLIGDEKMPLSDFVPHCCHPYNIKTIMKITTMLFKTGRAIIDYIKAYFLSMYSL